MVNQNPVVGKDRSLRLYHPSLDQREEQAVIRVLRSGWLVAGPEVEAFEQEFARFSSSRFAVAVSSGTAALALVMQALGLGPNQEVVVPAYTFIATANTARNLGARVVLADVSPDSFNLTPASLAKVLGPRTALVVPVHQYGLPAPLAELSAVLGKIPVLEDAACANGIGFDWAEPGAARGLAACTSFHPRKIMTTGEGGMVTTNDEQLARQLRLLREHGLREGQAIESGHNYRLSEIAAAIGRVQLEKYPDLLAGRKRAAAQYRHHLVGLEWLRLPDEVDAEQHAFQSYVVRLLPGAPLSRDEILSRLQADAIPCQRGVRPVHLHPLYRRENKELSLPVSEMLDQTALFLPMSADLSVAEVERVCRAVCACG